MSSFSASTLAVEISEQLVWREELLIRALDSSSGSACGDLRIFRKVQGDKSGEQWLCSVNTSRAKSILPSLECFNRRQDLIPASLSTNLTQVRGMGVSSVTVTDRDILVLQVVSSLSRGQPSPDKAVPLTDAGISNKNIIYTIELEAKLFVTSQLLP
ncbi:hypothetical protein RRG08_025546 [Elysia crispata]|uniref:Uncharacterized protein n=1 Tax=Elysia crispata TaxID=231223 RepID=A0AAE1B758_9GAST|nr:hypothetical protein RRG08_025546 [Elysia crispata]